MPKNGRDAFFASLGYHRHKDGFRGKGYYYIIGGYDLTKEQADDIWKTVQREALQGQLAVLEDLWSIGVEHGIDNRIVELKAQLAALERRR